MSNERLESCVLGDNILNLMGMDDDLMDFTATAQEIGCFLAERPQISMCRIGDNKYEGQSLVNLMKIFIGNENIKNLTFDNNNIDYKSSRAIADLLNCNTNLRELDLSNITFTDGEYSTALDSFKFMMRVLCGIELTALSLNNIYINDTAVGSMSVFGEEISKILRSCTTLKTLSLEDNDDNLQWVKKIAPILMCNTSLTDLKLYHNKPEGVTAIAKALISNNTLKILDLTGNVIDQKAVEEIARMLSVNTSLRELYLCDTHINNEGATSLLSTLKRQNGGIEELDLSGNDIDDNLIGKIDRICHEHRMQNNPSVFSRQVVMFPPGNPSDPGNPDDLGSTRGVKRKRSFSLP